jgi:hypothetical protein
MEDKFEPNYGDVPRDAKGDPLYLIFVGCELANFERKMKSLEAGWRETGDPLIVQEATTLIRIYRQTLPPWLDEAVFDLTNKIRTKAHAKRAYEAHVRFKRYRAVADGNKLDKLTWTEAYDQAARVLADTPAAGDPDTMRKSYAVVETTPGAAVSYEYVATRLRDLVNDYRINKIAFDRWGMNDLKPALLRAGFSESEVKNIFVEFGQGFKSMSPALRDLEALILERKIRHGNHPVLAMCAANAIVTDDPAGNRKLDKKRASGRVDGMIALTMALAAAPSAWTTPVEVASLIG